MRILYVLLAFVPAIAGDSWKPIHVETEAGNVTGRLGGGELNNHCAFTPFKAEQPGAPDVATFYGIPYAQAPSGALRFAPPLPRRSWAPKTLDATTTPPICPQSVAVPHPAWTPHWVPGFSTHEDCLTLNVWTKVPFSSSLGGSRPVFAFIHGGAFIGGNGYQDFGCAFYDGNSMAANAGLVVVTMNYRLGPFGFLDLPQLRAESGTAGNYGIQDQRLALKWIQRNIASFGGDSNQVTIAGESAGAVSVLHHLVLPRSRGLFSRAIAESPYFNPSTQSGSLAQERGASFVQNAGCSEEKALECLRNTSIDKLLKAQDLALRPFFAGALDYYPVADGYELPVGDTLMTAFSKIESTQQVPLLLGTNFNETSLFQCGKLKENLGEQEAVAVLQDMSNALFDRNITSKEAGSLLANYRVGPGNFPSSRSAVIGAVTDVVFSCPTRQVSHSLASAGGKPVYQYLLARSPRFFRIGSCIGVPHIADTFYVFYNDVIGSMMDKGDKIVAGAIRSSWEAFARGDDPTFPANFSNEAWPKWDDSEEKTFVFDESPKVLAKYHKAGCEVVRDVIWQGSGAQSKEAIVV